MQSKLQTKSSSSNSFYLHTNGSPVWTERHYTQLAKESYMNNVIANRALAMIATACSSVKILCYKGNKQEITDKKHPIIKLINKPSAFHSWSNFIEVVIHHKLISGNAYINAVAGDFDAKILPHELFILRPDRMTLIAGKNHLPLSYRYYVDGAMQEFMVDRVSGNSDILHLKNFHPLNDWYGMSAIEPVSYSIDQHNESSKWNKSLLQNSAKPSGALIIKQGGLTGEQYAKLQDQFQDKFVGSINVGTPMLLEGDLEWQEMSLSPREMDFIENRNISAREIALGLGVPPHLLGIPGDNTYSNLSEARIFFWEQTVIPTISSILSSLTSWLNQYSREEILLDFDRDSIPCLENKNEIMWKKISEASFLSDNEKREMLGFSKR